MPNFPENTGFKLPGLGSKEKDTPGNFREEQGVENVGYCSTTEESMLPAGSSPLLAKGQHHDTGWIVPPADTPSYTGSSWPTGKSEKQRIQEQPGVPAKDKSVGEGFTPPEKPVLGVEEFEIPGDPGDPGTPDETIKRNKSWLDRENELKAQGMTSEEINSTIATEKNWRYNTEEGKVAKNVGMTEVIKGKPKVDAKPGGTGYNYTIGDRTVDKSEYCSHPDANHSSCN